MVCNDSDRGGERVVVRARSYDATSDSMGPKVAIFEAHMQQFDTNTLYVLPERFQRESGWRGLGRVYISVLRPPRRVAVGLWGAFLSAAVL